MRRPENETVLEPQRDVPVYGHCDVLVVGGGPAGTCAAVAAEREGAGDGVEDLEAVLLRQVAAEVTFGELVNVHRHEPEVRPGLAVVEEAFEDLAEDDVGVRPAAVLGDEGGDALRHGGCPR